MLVGGAVNALGLFGCATALNDVLDYRRDRALHPERPIPSGLLTMDAAVGNPNAYLQAKAGHSQFSITERYVHAAQVAFPGAVELAESRIFQEVK